MQRNKFLFKDYCGLQKDGKPDQIVVWKEEGTFSELGIPYCGRLKNRILMVDTDGKTATEVMMAACRKAGIDPYRHESQSGGYHFFFKLPQTHAFKSTSKNCTPLGYFDGSHEGIDFKVGTATNNVCCYLSRPARADYNAWIAEWEGTELPDAPKWLRPLPCKNVIFTPDCGNNDESLFVLNAELEKLRGWNTDTKIEVFNFVRDLYNSIWWSSDPCNKEYREINDDNNEKRVGRPKRENRDLDVLDTGKLLKFLSPNREKYTYMAYDELSHKYERITGGKNTTALEEYFLEDLLDMGEERTDFTSVEHHFLDKRIRTIKSPDPAFIYFYDGKLDLINKEFTEYSAPDVMAPLKWCYKHSHTDKNFEDFELAKYYHKSNFDKLAMWLAGNIMHYGFKRNCCVVEGNSDCGKTYITDMMGKYVLPAVKCTPDLVWGDYYGVDLNNAHRMTIVSDLGKTSNMQRVNLDLMLDSNTVQTRNVKGSQMEVEPHAYLCTTNYSNWWTGSLTTKPEAIVNRVFQFELEYDLPKGGFKKLGKRTKEKINSEWDEFGVWIRNYVIELCTNDEIDYEEELEKFGKDMSKLALPRREEILFEVLDAFADVEYIGQVSQNDLKSCINSIFSDSKAQPFNNTFKITTAVRKYGWDFDFDSKRGNMFLKKDGKFISNKQMTKKEFNNLLYRRGIIE